MDRLGEEGRQPVEGGHDPEKRWIRCGRKAQAGRAEHGKKIFTFLDHPQESALPGVLAVLCAFPGFGQS